MTSLASLLQRASIEDHEQVLQSANACLAKSKSDIYAQHAKAVAFLKLDRYEDCLRFFEEAGDILKSKASLEYAYALYKCGRLQDAVKVLSHVGDGRGARHLEAQAVCKVFQDYYDGSGWLIWKFCRSIVPRDSVAPQIFMKLCRARRMYCLMKKMTFGSMHGRQMLNCSGRVIQNQCATLDPCGRIWKVSRLRSMLPA